MISKKRYWGLALPIWTCSKCGNFDVIGSEEELNERAVEGWEIFKGHTPHRPWIDAVKIKCSKCGSLTSRTPDVGNPWLDAGIVPYSTLEYRHDREHWRNWFPAEFICESLPGQFRNWFYAMLAMSTVIEDCTPFKTCFGHGDVLGEDGREMHKSWGNVILFDDAAETMGADVMRWIYCSIRPEPDMLFGYKRADDVKKRFMIPLWNIYSFFVTYANLDKWKPGNTTSLQLLSPLDRWILSKLNMLVQDVTNRLDNYEPYEAATSIEKFVDDLSKWYVRRSRRRFWKSEQDEDKNAAYTTLHGCLVTLIKLLAPFVPFITEEMYQNLVRGIDPNAKESIHHDNWPTPNETMIDKELTSDMDLTIKVCDLGRSARATAGMRLRQPLSEAKIVADAPTIERLEKFKSIIIDELNVKTLTFASDKDELMEPSVRLRPEILGRKYGSLFPKLSEAIKKTDPKDIAQAFQKGLAAKIRINDTDVELQPEEVELSTKARTSFSLSEEDNIIVGVHTVITDELRKEGLARDIIRRIQNQRKEAKFSIADLIKIYYEAEPELTKVFSTFGKYIAEETLSTSIKQARPPKRAHTATYNINGKSLLVGLIRVKKQAATG